MAIYDKSSAAKTNAPSNVQKKEEGASDKKNRPQDLVPEENKALVQKKDEGTPPADEKKPEATTETTPAKTEQTPEEKKAAEEAKKKEHLAAVTETWQGVLGKWLGAEMAKVVCDTVSVDALNGYVGDLLKAGGPALADVFKDSTKTTDAKQIEGIKKFSEALNGALTGKIEAWVKSPAGQKVLASISGWVEDNPKAVLWIVGGAVLGGAVIAWLANPALDVSVPLGLPGDWKLKAGIDMGKLKDIVYQGASLAVESKSTKIEFKHEKKKADDGSTKESLEANASTEVAGAGGSLFKGSGGVKITETDVIVKLNGSMKANVAGQTIELEGGAQSDGPITGKIKIGDGPEYREVSGMKKGDEVSFSTKSVFTGGSFETKSGTDGKGKVTDQKTATANVGAGQTMTMTGGTEGNKIGYENKNVGGTGVGLNTSAGTNAAGQSEFKLGAKYDDKKLRLGLDVAMLDGKGSLSASGGFTRDNYTFDANLKISESRISEIGMKFGYTNPTEFKGFMLEYKRSWMDANKQYADEFDGRFEYAFGKLEARAIAGFDLQGGKLQKTNVDIGMAYPIGKGFKAIGGIQQNGMLNTQTNAMDMSYRPYIGAQYGGVALSFFHDTGGKGTTGIMLNIPIGRTKP